MVLQVYNASLRVAFFVVLQVHNGVLRVAHFVFIEICIRDYFSTPEEREVPTWQSAFPAQISMRIC